MLIKYYTREVYGSKYRYPVDPDIASSLLALTQRKTISHTDMASLSALGLTFEEVLQPDVSSLPSLP